MSASINGTVEDSEIPEIELIIRVSVTMSLVFAKRRRLLLP